MTDEAIHIDTDPMDRMICTQCKAELAVAGVESFATITCPECQAQLTVPARLGGFRLLDLLGKGGMGAVYRGEDMSLDRPVAIKVLLRSVGDDPAFVETFQKEAKAAAALSHPNIVQIYQFGREKGQPYIAMELLLGGRLDKMIAADSQIDPALVIKIGLDVAEGLKAAGDIGLVHGDIKPENILLDSNGTAKIVDFGLASFKDREGQREGIWGTPYYIAPEKLRGKPGDQRSDIYSLGGTLFHALTLKPPFDGNTAIDVVKARLREPAPLVSTLRDGVHPEIERVVKRMLEAEPRNRYPTYASLIADLRKVAGIVGPPRTVTRLKRATGKMVTVKGGKSIKATSMPGASSVSGRVSGDLSAAAAGKSGSRKSSGRVWGLVVGLLLLAGLGAGGWWFWQDYQAEQAELARQAALTRVRDQARETFSDLDDRMDRAHRRLTEAFPLLHGATNRLGQAAAELAGMASAPDLERLAPALANSPERMLVALDEAGGALDRLRGRIAVLSGQRDALRATQDPAAARTLLGEIRETVEDAEAEYESVLKRIDMVEQAHAALDGLDDLLAQQRDLATSAERRRLEEEQRQRELEAQRQTEAERQQQLDERAAEEQQQLDRVRDDVLVLIRQNAFEDALALVRKLRPDLQVEATQQQADLWIERLDLLPELKKTIIARLALAPFPWGWLGQRDVIGADEQSVHVPGRKIPWSEVPPAQMLRFIERYADAADFERVQRARFCMAAAVYAYENQALPMAQTYAQKAIGLQSRLKDEIQRIMPQIEGL